VSSAPRPTQFGRIHAPDEAWLAKRPPEPILELFTTRLRANGWAVVRMLSQPSRFTQRAVARTCSRDSNPIISAGSGSTGMPQGDPCRSTPGLLGTARTPGRPGVERA